MSDAKVTEADVLRALARVKAGEQGDLVSLNRIRGVKLCEGNVAFEVLGAPTEPAARKGLEHLCQTAVGQVPGVTQVNVKFASVLSELIPGVRRVIAVGSGKGGVGKSTVAVNLAAALAQQGYRVGLLDADVYGPSIPLMMGIRQQPEVEAGRLIPLERHGVKLMSLGFLMPDDQTHVIWRGPMVGNAVLQMLRDCAWGELDYLLVDLPPGTGDAQLTLAQSIPLSGAVVVMTSQDVAVNIASKAVGMFRKLNVPILGVVGNMDSFVCPHCQEATPIFTRGGSETAAARMEVPFLGSIPLDPATVEHGDAGTPTVVAAPKSAQGLAFQAVAEALLAQMRVLHPDTDEPERSGLGTLLGRFGRA